MIQTDFETDMTLVVFRSGEAASQAVRQLELRGIRHEGLKQVPLPAGTYQLVDTTSQEEARRLAWSRNWHLSGRSAAYSFRRRCGMRGAGAIAFLDQTTFDVEALT
jgi:hypothetical protein